MTYIKNSTRLILNILFFMYNFWDEGTCFLIVRNVLLDIVGHCCLLLLLLPLCLINIEFIHSFIHSLSWVWGIWEKSFRLHASHGKDSRFLWILFSCLSSIFVPYSGTNRYFRSFLHRRWPWKLSIASKIFNKQTIKLSFWETCYSE